MLNCWCITWPVGFKRLTHQITNAVAETCRILTLVMNWILLTAFVIWCIKHQILIKINNFIHCHSCICMSKQYRNCGYNLGPTYSVSRVAQSPPPLSLTDFGYVDSQSPVSQDDTVPQAPVTVAPDREDGFSRDVHLRILHWSTRRRHGGLHCVLPLQFDREVAECGAWNTASVLSFSVRHRQKKTGMGAREGGGRSQKVNGLEDSQAVPARPSGKGKMVAKWNTGKWINEGKEMWTVWSRQQTEEAEHLGWVLCLGGGGQRYDEIFIALGKLRLDGNLISWKAAWEELSATWIFGARSTFALELMKTSENFGRFGRSQCR